MTWILESWQQSAVPSDVLPKKTGRGNAESNHGGGADGTGFLGTGPCPPDFGA